jgi:hypothetical protein
MKKILAIVFALGIAPAILSADIPRYERPPVVRHLVRCHHVHAWHRRDLRRPDWYR